MDKLQRSKNLQSRAPGGEKSWHIHPAIIRCQHAQRPTDSFCPVAKVVWHMHNYRISAVIFGISWTVHLLQTQNPRGGTLMNPINKAEFLKASSQLWEFLCGSANCGSTIKPFFMFCLSLFSCPTNLKSERLWLVPQNNSFINDIARSDDVIDLQDHLHYLCCFNALKGTLLCRQPGTPYTPCSVEWNTVCCLGFRKISQGVFFSSTWVS